MRKLIWVLIAMPILLAGCGGFHASKSISPLDFLLPGLMQNDPSRPPVPECTNAPTVLAAQTVSVSSP